MALNAGKGAKGSILTRMIKPKQSIPNGSGKDHRSVVILVDRFTNPEGKTCYSFKYNLSDEAPLMHALARWVKIEEEGDASLLFDEPVETKKVKFVEPETKWRQSKAKQLLYDDVNEGRVPLDSKEDGNNKLVLKQIYLMHPEYADYDFEKFGSRLRSIRNTIKELRKRADEDQEAFDLFVQNHEISLYDKNGCIQWQGSESQRLLLEDIAAGKVEQYAGNKKELYLSRPEYYNEFPLKQFRDKIDQEIGTAKYLHTLKERGKMHKSS